MAAGLEPAELFAVSMEFASHGSHEHQEVVNPRDYGDVMIFHKDSLWYTVDIWWILCQGAMVETVGGQTTGQLLPAGSLSQCAVEDELCGTDAFLVVSAVIDTQKIAHTYLYI